MAMRHGKYLAALQDFRQARQHAALQQVLARLTGKSNQLLSYNEVVRKLRLSQSIERGVQPIPVNAIVGSVDRYTDFTRTFLPRRDEDQQRWARVKVAYSDPEVGDLPPIEVYKIGDAYFVLDGNHRVSIAKLEGQTHVDAHVIEVQTNIPLSPDVQPEDLIVKAEYADFLEVTGLAALRPNVDLTLTVPGGYAKLKEEIAVQCYWSEQAQQCAVPFAQAVENWYDEVYTPAAETIRDRGLLRWFPKRTVTDFYLWVSEHRESLENELGWTIRPQAAVAEWAERKTGQAGTREGSPGTWRKARLFDRYTERLFMDILVPLSGTPECWQALEQALAIAAREEAHLHGLYIVAAEAQKKSQEALAIQSRFNRQCQAAGIEGSLAIETGDVTRKIRERALLTDLVVLNLAHPPGAGLAALGSGLRTIIWQSARPILTVPGKASPLGNALVAFDSSPKAREALFVGTYLAERWKTALTVVSIREKSGAAPGDLDYAREYLELHEVEADFVTADGPIDLVLRTAEERQIDLVLMGGYSVSALEEVIAGSAVNLMLRQAHCPIFICR